MNVILMSVLLTLLGVGLVVLLVWLSVASWKSIKHRKQSELNEQAIWSQFDTISTDHSEWEDQIRKDFEEQITELHRRIEDVYSNINEKESNLYLQVNEIEKNIYEDVGKIQRDLVENIQSLKNDVDNFKTTNNLRIVNLESSIDSRLDKIYNTIQFNDNELHTN